jgi:two-component system KDP operon response regulator KdpE
MGGVRIDLAKRTLVRASEKVPLTRNEYELIRCLVASAGKIMTHRELLQEVWGP